MNFGCFSNPVTGLDSLASNENDEKDHHRCDADHNDSFCDLFELVIKDRVRRHIVRHLTLIERHSLLLLAGTSSYEQTEQSTGRRLSTALCSHGSEAT